MMSDEGRLTLETEAYSGVAVMIISKMAKAVREQESYSSKWLNLMMACRNTRGRTSIGNDQNEFVVPDAD